MEMMKAMLCDGVVWMMDDGEKARGVEVYKHDGRNARKRAVSPICFGITL
jgi:hypothetical protein